jgi:hypothetical protein
MPRENPTDTEIQELREAIFPAAQQAIILLEGFINRDPNQITEAVVQLFLMADKAGLLE